MANFLTESQHVYKCDTCNRTVKVPPNPQGIEIVDRCIITASCLGKMLRVTDQSVINNTPTFPPEVTGLKDWSARSVLYTHTQTVASLTWNVTHNLENNPTVYVYTQQNTINGLVPTITDPKSIEIIDLNNIRITFDSPQSGLAQCIALSSQQAATPTTTAISVSSTSDVLITNQGVLTFATLDPSTYVNITMTFNSPSSPQPIVIQFLNLTTPAGVSSPWAGANYVTINSKKYYLRSVNLITYQPAVILFQSGMISNGATAYLPNSTLAGQVLLLLANNPQTVADRVYDRYIDTVAASTPSSQLYYSDGNMYVTQSLIKNTYPPIFVG